MDRHVEEIVGAAFAESTLENYIRVWDKFQCFITHELGIEMHLPVDPILVARYLAYLYLNMYSASTVTSVASVIAFAHRVRNLTDPTECLIVKKLLIGIRKLTQKPDKRKPILTSDLLEIIRRIPFLFDDRYTQVLLQSMITLQFAAGLRVGELAKTSKKSDHVLRLGNVLQMSSNGSLSGFRIIFTSYKHHDGKPADIDVHFKHNSTVCPVRALYHYLSLRKSQYAWLFVHKNGMVVTRDWYAKKLSLLLKSVGANPGEFNTHSLRIGAATELALKGASLAEIKSFGRWRSFAFVKYIRPQVISV